MSQDQEVRLKTAARGLLMDAARHQLMFTAIDHLHTVHADAPKAIETWNHYINMITKRTWHTACEEHKSSSAASAAADVQNIRNSIAATANCARTVMSAVHCMIVPEGAVEQEFFVQAERVWASDAAVKCMQNVVPDNAQMIDALNYVAILGTLQGMVCNLLWKIVERKRGSMAR